MTRQSGAARAARLLAAACLAGTALAAGALPAAAQDGDDDAGGRVDGALSRTEAVTGQTGPGEDSLRLMDPGALARNPDMLGLRVGEGVPVVPAVPGRDLLGGSAAGDDPRGFGPKRVFDDRHLASGTLEKAEALRGNAVAGASARPVGEVEAVVLGPSGQRRYLVIATLKQSGLGGAYVPVPEHQFRRIGPQTLQLLVEDELLAQAPRYPRADIIRLSGNRWPQEIDAWWRRNVEQAGSTDAAAAPDAAPLSGTTADDTTTTYFPGLQVEEEAQSR